jgi:hypothetical protein
MISSSIFITKIYLIIIVQKQFMDLSRPPPEKQADLFMKNNIPSSIAKKKKKLQSSFSKSKIIFPFFSAKSLFLKNLIVTAIYFIFFV